MPPFLSRLFCVLTLLGTAAVQAQTSYTQGGYADRTSVPAGGTIHFRIATATSPFSLQIVNLAQPATVLATIGGLTSAPIDCTGLWENGCGWPVTTAFTVPSNWPSGYYKASFPTSIGTRNILFVVRAANPGLATPVVIVSPTNTWQAYNNFGGKSVYDSLSTDGQRAHVVSWNRPYFDNFGLGRYPAWEQYLVDWMTAENRPFEVITDDDLADPSILAQYKVAVIAGHSEYWTLPMRQTLAAFMAGGGHVAVFSGNTMWWQARADLAARQFTVYKDASLDPFTGTQDSLVTVNFYDRPVYNPESLLLGASFLHGGYANVTAGTTTPLPVDQRTPYTIRDASSFVFSGTGLANGQTFGQSAAGTEVDGVVFNTLPDGTLLPDGSDGAPLNYQIVATVPGWSGYGTIGMLVNPNGSALFNAASRDWLRGLPGDAAVQQIARNVLDRFATGQPFPYTPRTSRYRTEELFNTPQPNPGVLPGWRTNLNAPLSAQCAHEGALGLQLQSTQWLVLHRSFTPTNVGRSAAVASFFVNIDLLQSTPTFALPLVELVDTQATTKVFAAVELMTQPQGISVRLAIRKADGGRSGTSPWVVMPSGWQPVMLAWSSPGTVELQVGSGILMQLNNPHNNQTVNELMVEFPGTVNNTNGSICLDELRVRDTIDPPPSALTSTITADPTTLTADGTSTSTITVRLKGAKGDDLARGGAEVTLATTRGTLSAVTDDNDGTYTATLTASTSAGLATISGTVNGAAIVDTATVNFAAAVTAPTNVDAVTITTTRVRITWAAVANAASYRVERSTDNVTFTPVTTVSTLTADDTPVIANASYLYRVVALDAGGNPSPPSARDVATTRQFTSDPLRVLRAAHINDLRAAINTFRAAAGLSPASYTSGISAGSLLKRTNVTEMRSAVDAARAAIGLAPYPYAESIVAGTRLKWNHFRELQNTLGALIAPP